MSRLAIVVSHPIQYYSPLFKKLSKELKLKVFYGFNPNEEQQGKDGFGQAFKWDIELLEGYDFEFLKNISKSPSSSQYKGCDTPEVDKFLNIYAPTHVISFGWHLKMYHQVLIHCKKNNIPIAVRGDSQLNPSLPLWKKFLKKISYPIFLNKYDAFLSVGSRNRKYLSYYGVHDQKLIFSPHAIDQKFWKVTKTAHESSFIFIWIAKFIPLKRPFDVINAFKRISKDANSFKKKIYLKMIGSGSLMDEARELAKGYDQIQFLGFKNQTELKSFYAEADCLILSSDSETWGLVVNEAFAAGIPAIVSDACGCSPDLINEYTGRVYPTANLEELQIAMLKILQLKNDSQYQTDQIKALAEKNEIYSFERIIESFQHFINNY